MVYREEKASIVDEELGEFSQETPVFSRARTRHFWNPRRPLTFPFQSPCLPEFSFPNLVRFCMNLRNGCIDPIKNQPSESQSHFLTHRNRCCFPLETALLGPGVSDAAQASGPSSAKWSHSFSDSVRWLSNRTGQLCFPLPGTLLPRPSAPAGPPPEVTLIPLLWLLVPLGRAVCSKMEMLQGLWL